MAQRSQSVYMNAIKFAQDLATGRHALSKLIPPILWLCDAVLCGLIIWKIPCTPLRTRSIPPIEWKLTWNSTDTEIDWVAYMEQVSQFVSGERDYTKIEGGTGPLVYPAAHVYIYTGLYYLANEGEDIFLAQQLFTVLYMATLALVMLCYWKAKVGSGSGSWRVKFGRLNNYLQVPPYIFPLLILSKRLHSVFVLRCFNDCFAAFFLWAAIYCYQRRHWTLGSLAYSCGLGTKMSLLLVLPAVAVTLFLGRGFRGSLKLAWLMAQVQIVIAVPFMVKNPWGYLARAFELSRQFKFEWTVNWRMMGEEVFLSKSFALVLLAMHVSVLLIFITARWMRPMGKSVLEIATNLLRGVSPLDEEQERAVTRRIGPQYVMTTILTANVIGLLFARSLHYQFYAYLAWATPYLLWRSCPNPLLVPVLWGVQEWAWNVFPSTPSSSAAVVNVLALVVTFVYFVTAKDFQPEVARRADEAKNK